MSKPTLNSVAESGLYQLADSLWAGSVKVAEIQIEWTPEVQALGNEYNLWRLQQATSKAGLYTQLQSTVYAAWVPGVAIWRQEYKGWTYEHMEWAGMGTGDFPSGGVAGDSSSLGSIDDSIRTECLERTATD